MATRTEGSWVKFDRFQADLTTGELFRGEKRLDIQEKPFRVLELLIRARGMLVSRDELFHSGWPDVHVERNRCLNNAIRKLRSVLGDSASHPRIIETIGSRGYRFLPEVEWSRPEAEDKLRVAVLPFQNLSPDGDDYFSDGLTEQIIAQLGRRYQQIAVIAPASAMQYKGTDKEPPQIGRELATDYILCGSVLRSGSQFRITARLIRTEDQSCLWAEIYSRQTSDIFAVQDDITRHIASALSRTLPVAGNTNPNLTTSADIYEKHLKARFFAGQATQAGFSKAVDLFQQVIGEDPSYAPGYAGLAVLCTMVGQYGPLPPSVLHGRVRMLASRAMDLCPDLPEVHAALAMTELLYEANFEAAEKGFLRALEISPSSAFAHQGYSQVMTVLGQHEKALAAMQRALQLDPLSPIVGGMLACALYFAGRLEDALRQIRATAEMHPNFPLVLATMGWILSQMKDHEAALSACRAAAVSAPESGLFLVNLAEGLAAAGENEEARAALKRVVESRRNGWISSYCIALVHVSLGEHDLAFEWLDSTLRERDGWRVLAAVDPRLKPLHADPRFAQFLQRVGLVRAPRAAGTGI